MKIPKSFKENTIKTCHHIRYFERQCQIGRETFIQLVDHCWFRLRKDVEPSVMNTSKYEQSRSPTKRFFLEMPPSNMNTSLFWTWTLFFSPFCPKTSLMWTYFFWLHSLFFLMFFISDAMKCIFNWFKCNTCEVRNGNKTQSHFTRKNTSNFW